MAIRDPLTEAQLTLAQGHRRATDVAATSQPLPRHARGAINTQSSLPTSWEHMPQHFNVHSNHRASRSAEFGSYPQSPASARLSSPFAFTEASVSPAGFPLSLRNDQREATKREAEAYDCVKDGTLSSTPSFVPYYESASLSHSLASGPRQTRSVTPDLGGGYIYSKRPRMSPASDPITAILNQARMMNKKEKKEPLLPVAGLSIPKLQSEATSIWDIPPAPDTNNPFQQPQPPQEVRKRRTRSLETTHCNIKYHVEELDYIRYHRVDLGLKWSLVESKFRDMFPTTRLSVTRKAGGLQGVNYRQNKFLPHINEAGELIFMRNGHVQPVCIKTRDQTDKKQLYTLVYLYPERALTYPWVSPSDRGQASDLNVGRQIQMERGRREAQLRGSYIEHLPSDAPCGCCPGEDRERGKAKRPVPKMTYKRRRPHHMYRAKL
ncbi:hypothetical protein F5Y14DRAFT_369002 [Nemania sp. NC0429]|nr:hypothetical protein F5Y14DRAFT_369002 [Nemania sp. NC0429]